MCIKIYFFLKFWAFFKEEKEKNRKETKKGKKIGVPRPAQPKVPGGACLLHPHHPYVGTRRSRSCAAPDGCFLYATQGMYNGAILGVPCRINVEMEEKELIRKGLSSLI